jgi:branched-chain amino acid transport system permease protein
MLFLQLLVNGIVTGCALGVVSFSFSLVYSTTKVFHVVHAGIYTLAGYLALTLAETGLPDGVALVAVPIVCAGAGALVQILLYAPLDRRRATHLAVLIASLGLLAIVQNAIAAVYSPNILQFPSAWRGQTLRFAGLTLTLVQVTTVLLSLLLYAATSLITSRTTLGKRIRAVASNPSLAEITRLEPARTYVAVMALASANVAIPGILVGLDLGLQPYTGTTVLLTGTVAVIAGGVGSLAGAFLLSIVITVMQNLSLLIMPGQWSVGITFLIFVLFMLWRPRGLFVAA